MATEKLWKLTTVSNACKDFPHPLHIERVPRLPHKKMIELEDDGDVLLLSPGKYVGWTSEERAGKCLQEGDVVAVMSGGSPGVRYWKGKFVASGSGILFKSRDPRLLNRFLYLFLEFAVDDSFYRGGALRTLDLARVLNLPVPLPPIERQRAVAKASELAAELEAELARVKRTTRGLLLNAINSYSQ